MAKLFLCSILALYTCAHVFAQAKITIAVAANMQYAIDAVKQEFNKTNKTKIEVVLGASGKLTQQIMSGAPFDIFISADTAFPQRIADTGLAAEQPMVYAQGRLVLWSTRPGIKPATDLKILLIDDIKHIAIANPKTAPYGWAAEFLLKKYGLYDAVSGKLVRGESITQTSQFIVTQAADIGFTAKAIVLSDEMKNKGNWVELNNKDYPPIKQAAVLLKYGQQNHTEEAKKFYDFLFSGQAKAVYKKFGYVTQ